jgi:arylsulfatase
MDLPKLNSSQLSYLDEYYRKRIQSLQAVDELVESVVTKLEDYGLLENTYIFYTSDNGYHMGQHRMTPGKGCPYEEDVNVPMIIRGPGVPKRRTVDFVTSHTDIAATFFDLAGIPLRDDFDGLPMPLTVPEMHNAKSDPRREHLSVEFWGTIIEEGDIGRVSPTEGALVHSNNTYKAMRVIGDTYNLFYSVWCTNEHELYDMTVSDHSNFFPCRLKLILTTE